MRAAGLACPGAGAGLIRSDLRGVRVTEEQENGPHQLTCRQAERTFGLITRALKKDEPDGTPPLPSPPCWMTCWKPASQASTRPPQRRWPPAGLARSHQA